jgi:cytochrome c oxidase assembly factor CtaG
VWSFDPRPTAGILAASLLYGWGLSRLWRHAGPGRGVRPRQAACFAGGIIVLALSLISPIDTLSDDLAWAHMTQHMMLMLVAAPLLVAGSPGIVAAWAMPHRWRQPLARLWASLGLRETSRWLLWHPVALWLLFAIVLWVWHLPALYEAALQSGLIHDVQHLAFLGAACLYWRVLFDPIGRVKLTPALGVAYLFTTSLHGMLLGLFMALSPRYWYPSYGGTTQAWGLSPLEDQQVAGFIMWMPACALYGVIAVGALAMWLHRSEQSDALAPAAPPEPGTGA